MSHCHTNGCEVGCPSLIICQLKRHYLNGFSETAAVIVLKVCVVTDQVAGFQNYKIHLHVGLNNRWLLELGRVSRYSSWLKQLPEYKLTTIT